MAHFAKLDDNNVVTQVVVVDNSDTADAFGVEKEHIGAAFLERVLGGVWKQTSYNNKIRKNYAGIGFTFDAQRDAFIPPKPFDSWVLVEESCQWNPPVPYPDDGKPYTWDESNLQWVEV